MHSFIITSRSSDTQKNHALAFCKTLDVDPIDITLVDTIIKVRDEDKGTEKTLAGIALIRDTQKKLYLKPIRGQKKAIVILHADSLSIPAQNALLKSLEEPPTSTYIILTAKQDSFLLPTILSRCLKVVTNEDKEAIHEESFLLSEDIASNALQKAEELAKQKDAVLVFLEQEIRTLHMKIYKTDNNTNIHNTKKIFRTLKSCLLTYKLIKTTNINTRFALENLFLSI